MTVCDSGAGAVGIFETRWTLPSPPELYTPTIEERPSL